MRQEAIELIVALKGHTLPKGAKNAYNRLCKAIEQASSVSSIQSDKTSDAEKQEPVAWMHTKIEGVAVPHRPADLDKHPDRWEALYKTPPPCPTCEALARTVMMDQTAHDTAPQPQRELNCVCGAVWEGDEMVCVPHKRAWVGLTDEDKQNAFDDTQEGGGFWEFADAIEAKLKEKNT